MNNPYQAGQGQDRNTPQPEAKIEVWKIRDRDLPTGHTTLQICSREKMREYVRTAKQAYTFELDSGHPPSSQVIPIKTPEQSRALRAFGISLECLDQIKYAQLDNGRQPIGKQELRMLSDIEQLLDLCEKLCDDPVKHYPEFLAKAPELEPALDHFGIDLTILCTPPGCSPFLHARLEQLRNVRQSMFSLTLDSSSLPSKEMPTVVTVVPHDGVDYTISISVPARPANERCTANPPREKRSGQPYAPIPFEDVENALASGKILLDCFEKYVADAASARTYGRSSFFQKVKDWQALKSSGNSGGTHKRAGSRPGP